MPPGPVWTGAENLAPTGVRSAECPSRSETLHRLRHLGPQSRCLHLQEIKPDITRDICSARVKTFRCFDCVVLDESRNFDILVDGKIHDLE